MAELLQKCSVCNKSFHVQYSYQMEEQTLQEDGEDRTAFRFFCSQECVRDCSAAQLHACDACGTACQITEASQTLFIRGKRHYACAEACREQLLAEQQGVRLGQMLDGDSTSNEVNVYAPSRMQRAALSAESVLPDRKAEASDPEVARRSTPQRPTISSKGGPQVLAVFNHKGGTGKTTTAVTIAAGLARQGKRTLLVDTDAQGNVAVSLGLQSPRSLYHVLVMGLGVESAVQKARENLDVLPSNETLAAAELYLAGRKNRDQVLRSRLAAARENYDYVIVDCSPSLSLLNQNALVFADAVLCPVACDYLSLVGVRQVVKTIKNVNRLLGHPVQLWGVLPTLYDKRARICAEALETLQEHFGDRCLNPIRSVIRVKEAPSQAKTLFEYAADCQATTDYNQVVTQLIAAAQQAPQTTNLAATA